MVILIGEMVNDPALKAARRGVDLACSIHHRAKQKAEQLPYFADGFAVNTAPSVVSFVS